MYKNTSQSAGALHMALVVSLNLDKERCVICFMQVLLGVISACTSVGEVKVALITHGNAEIALFSKAQTVFPVNMHHAKY